MAVNVTHEHHHAAPYWGAATATLDWCEENYHQTPLIAEFCMQGKGEGPSVYGAR